MVFGYIEIIVDFEEPSYTVREGAAILNLYVKLVSGSIERAFPSTVAVEFTTTDISTSGQ